MPQTTVLSTELAAYPGQVAHSGNVPRFEETLLAEDVNITSGQPILQGTGDKQGLSVTDGATLDVTTFLGFAVLDIAREPGAYVVGDTFNVLRMGTIWVATTGAVTRGNPVYAGNATAQLQDIDDATGTGLVLVPGCKFLDTTAGAGLARVIVLPIAA